MSLSVGDYILRILPSLDFWNQISLLFAILTFIISLLIYKKKNIEEGISSSHALKRALSAGGLPSAVICIIIGFVPSWVQELRGFCQFYIGIGGAYIAYILLREVFAPLPKSKNSDLNDAVDAATCSSEKSNR